MNISIASVVPTPSNRSLVTTVEVLDEIPGDYEVDVFALPQVIQVAYPVRGSIVNVFALPRVINIVIDD